jgi:hypothetical protein
MVNSIIPLRSMEMKKQILDNSQYDYDTCREEINRLLELSI